MIGEKIDCIVDDVAAIIARLPLTLRARHYTTQEIVNEVKDRESRESLEFIIEAGLIEVKATPNVEIEIPSYLNRKLSEADKSLLKLSIILRSMCNSIALATDDYALQEAAVKLGLNVIPVRYRGAWSVRRSHG